MRSYRAFILGGALVALLGAADVASAAWNNVFQATCFHKKQPAVSHYVPVPVVAQSPPVVAYSNPCDPCPKTVCSTSYVQRCYYQPITSYTTKTYYEPVTTMQTSYYYEPVVSYKYSCYYDPCTCSYQQVAVPSTSYCLKAKSCPVQSWVQKCCQVPVTSYQKCCYWEPQTTCCTTTPGVAAPVYPPAPNGGSYGGPPPVNEQKIPGLPPSPPSNLPPKQENYYGPPTMGEGSQTKAFAPPAYNGWQSGSQPSLGNPVPALKPLNQAPAAPKAAPIPLDKVASNPGNPVKGQVVTFANAPKPNTQLMFVPASQNGLTKTATANAGGQFNVSLTSGQWHVYIQHANGQKAFHSKIQISEEQPSYLTLVSK
jgi:hypothetical protein